MNRCYKCGVPFGGKYYRIKLQGKYGKIWVCQECITTWKYDTYTINLYERGKHENRILYDI